METAISRCSREDFEDFYTLRCDEENVLWTGHKEAPEKERLRAWFYSQLARDDRTIFIVRESESRSPVGYLYVDVLGPERDVLEIGYGIDSRLKGRGLATRSVAFAVDHAKKQDGNISRIEAWIASDNFGSIKVALKNGFRCTPDRKRTFFEGFGREVDMVRYELPLDRSDPAVNPTGAT